MKQLRGQDTVVDSSLRETTSHGTEAFPMAVYLDDFSCFKNGSIIWHWHEEAQISFITEGEFYCHVGGERMLMGPGDLIFINSRALHQIIPLHRAQGRLYSFLWRPELLGNPAGDMYASCVQPLLGSPRKCVFFPTGHPLNARMQASLKLIIKAMLEKFSFYQLHVTLELARIWLRLCQLELDRSPVSAAQLSALAREEQKVKDAIGFFEAHYAEKISLDMAAKAAMTNRSELCRCFRHVLDMSPGDYLMQHRLARALSLLEDPDMRIADIAELCGFCSPSHFGTNFRKYLGCTPLQYRKQSLD